MTISSKSIRAVVVCLILFIFLMSFLACNHPKSNSGSINANNAKVNNENPKQLKNKREYEEMLLDGGTDKVIDLLGTPDTKGESPNGYNGYYVYYEKVWDEGRAKHLVIAYNDHKVNRIKTAIFGETVALPGGRVTIERPAGYQSEGSNESDEITKIERLYASVDTVHTTAFLDGENGVFYRTYRAGNLTLYKEIQPGQGDTSFTEYLFVDGKIRFKYFYDQLKGLYPEKVYISYNGNVIKYLRNNVDTPCDKNEYCKYDEFSTPYFLLKKHGSN
jgi:hypothetical protein